MARLTFETKENARVAAGVRKNKVVAEDLNEIKESVNALYDTGAEWPKYSTAARDLLTGLSSGVRIYNTTTGRPEYYNGSAWLPVAFGLTDIHCGSSPNYPAALRGTVLNVTASGKIGGSSGVSVYAGDIIICIASNNGGTEAEVGTSWKLVGDKIKTVKVTLSPAEVLDSYANPVELIAAPGPGKAIQPITFSTRVDFYTTAYATNVAVGIGFDPTYDFSHDISGTDAFLQTTSFNLNAPVPVNYPLMFKTNTGNPTDGDSYVDVYIVYQIIDL